MFYLVVTKFNDETFEQNYTYRLKHKLNGCIYGVQHCMSPKIELNASVFIVEMNNSSNKIEGIGFAKNYPNSEKKYKIYKDPNYNRFIYIGKYRLSRQELLCYDSELVEILDYILFKEKTHLKRGSGFMTIPEKLLRHVKCNNKNIKNDVKNLFQRLFCQNIIDNSKENIEHNKIINENNEKIINIINNKVFIIEE